MAYYNGYNGYNPNTQYYPGNTMNNVYMQQQMQQLQQQQQQQQQQPQMQQAQQQLPISHPAEVLKGRRVATVEEVKAIQIDLDGSLNFFPSTDGKKIYTKQLNLDGTVAIREYKLSTDLPAEGASQTEEESKLIQSLMNRVKSLEDTQQELLKSLGGK